ncbi:MAG TPA: TlpA disulfide reductase family protein [Blastocatellia bacterium]|nr:TlpA disulfide reductase family protein [Blastocatellia bacterium]
MKPQTQSSKSTWNITRFGLIGSAIILLAAITYNCSSERTVLDSTSEGDRAASRRPEPLSDTVMQASINLLDGKTMKLSDYSGKVLVVDLWATWCGPCRLEIPHLVQIARDYKSKGVEVIGLTNEDPETDAQKVKRFSEDYSINYPVGWADGPMQMGLMRGGRGGIPQTYIIGRDGKVVKHFVGFNPNISPPQMKAAIDEAVEGA